jgi:hypothetical protein
LKETTMLKRLAAAAATALLLAAHAGGAAAAPVNPQIATDIFSCMAPALPKAWRKTWMIVRQSGAGANERHMEAEFYYTTSERDLDGVPLRGLACKRDELIDKIIALNQYLAPDKWGWTRVTVLYSTDDKGDIQFKIQYDYPEKSVAPPDK